MSIFAVIALFVVSLESMVSSCPPDEDLAPLCSCIKFSGDYMMTCKGVLSPDDLISPMRSISMRKLKIYSLQFDDSTLQYIPHGIFEGTNIEKIRFFQSEIMSLSDSDVAFSGLEASLTEIRATEAEYVASWDWQQLRNLQNIELIDVNWIILSSIDQPLPLLPKLNALGITRSEISFIVDSAFSELPNLRILTLKDNDITELKRNMFPVPAEHLIIMDLSNNKISFLPEDMFSSMPSIDVVHLDNNQFATLPENPFSQAFSKLNEFSMSGNPIRCDCRIRWLAENKVPAHFIASCSSPESLKGRAIGSLDIKLLWC